MEIRTMKAVILRYWEAVGNWKIWKLIESNEFFYCVTAAFSIVISGWFLWVPSEFAKSDEYFIKGCELQREVSSKLLFDFTTCRSIQVYGAKSGVARQSFADYPCEAARETFAACVKAKDAFEVSRIYANNANSYTKFSLYLVLFLCFMLASHGYRARLKMDKIEKAGAASVYDYTT